MANSNFKQTPKNKKSVAIKAVIFPLVAGIIIAAVAVGFRFDASFFDIANNSDVAYFDSNSDANEIARLKYGDCEFPVVDGFNYSSLNTSVCRTKGSAFGEVGVGYCLVLQNRITSLNKQNITVSASDKSYKYKYKYSFSANNENEVFNQPCNVSKGVVLYFQNADDYGFSSDYTALVYEEVAE